MKPKTIVRKYGAGLRKSGLRAGIASRGSKMPQKRKKTKPLGKLLKKADELFSLQIRARDKHCQFRNCKSVKGLQNSHYIGRAVKSTRFDPDNCIALCWFHHFKSKDLGFEYQKQRTDTHGYDGQYTLFMQNKLGADSFKELINRSKQGLKLNREYLEKLLQDLSTGI